MREVRLALLEADVNYKVAKDFTNAITEKCIGANVMESLTAAQMVIKIVRDELTALMGSEHARLKTSDKIPTIIMMCGLQGTGKTTTSGKLAKLFKNKLNKKVLLVAGDVYRPAAIDQLCTIGKQVGVEVLNLGDKVNPLEIAKKGKEKAIMEGYDVVIIDTAGRLQIDETLMDELVNIEKKCVLMKFYF